MPEKGQNDLPAVVWQLPAVALLLALAPLPYGYYTLLRIVVCGAAALLAFNDFKRFGSVSFWVLLMGGIALLFNPIIPIHLSREVWAPINILTALALFIYWRARK